MRKITSVLLLSFLISCAQEKKIDCGKMLDKIPFFARQQTEGFNDSVKMDFDILKTCGNLDSIDKELITGPFLGMMMIEFATAEKQLTYKTVLNYIDEYKKTDNYRVVRKAVIASKTLENKIVTAESLETDNELLLNTTMTQTQIDSFKQFIRTNSSRRMTYKEAFNVYTAVKESSQPLPPEKVKFTPLTDLESAIETGKINGKRVLLYFSGYACVNGRKVEDRILTDDQVKSLMTANFACFVAYTDDKREDKKTNSTVGETFIKLQKEKFNTHYQPYFCIIDQDGKVLSETGYTNSKEEFIQFLNKGLK